jgi:hypothetical protein
VSTTLPNGDFIVWAALSLAAVQGTDTVPISFSTSGAGSSTGRLDFIMRATKALSMFCNDGGGTSQPVPADIAGAFDVGRFVVLMRRKNSIYSMAVKKVDGSTIVISADAAGAGSVPAATTVEVGAYHDGTLQIGGAVEGLFQKNGTFDDAAVTAILQAA